MSYIELKSEAVIMACESFLRERSKSNEEAWEDAVTKEMNRVVKIFGIPLFKVKYTREEAIDRLKNDGWDGYMFSTHHKIFSDYDDDYIRVLRILNAARTADRMNLDIDDASLLF